MNRERKELENKLAKINGPYDRPYGLLENPDRPGRISLGKTIMGGSAALWASMFLFPEYVGKPLYHLTGDYPLLALGLMAAIIPAGAYGIYATFTVPQLIKRAVIESKLERIDHPEKRTTPADVCKRAYQVLVGSRF